jgi:hypothetical protein
MRVLLIVVALLVGADFAYWRLIDHESATRDRVEAFIDQCRLMADELSAQTNPPMRPHFYEDALGVLPQHPLTREEQCTAVVAQCEIGFNDESATEASWSSRTKFVQVGFIECTLPGALWIQLRGPRRVEVLE